MGCRVVHASLAGTRNQTENTLASCITWWGGIRRDHEMGKVGSVSVLVHQVCKKGQHKAFGSRESAASHKMIRVESLRK